jgi:hypothetical protein
MPSNAVRWLPFCGPRKIGPRGMTLQNDTFAARNGATPGVPWRRTEFFGSGDTVVRFEPVVGHGVASVNSLRICRSSTSVGVRRLRPQQLCPRRATSTIVPHHRHRNLTAKGGPGSQVLDLQKDALIAAGVPERNIYSDTASGKKDDRPGLDACVLRRCARAIPSLSGSSIVSVAIQRRPWP